MKLSGLKFYPLAEELPITRQAVARVMKEQAKNIWTTYQSIR